MTASRSAPLPGRRLGPCPWTRVRRRRWARPNNGESTARLLAVLPSLPRAELARLTAAMIDRMDDDRMDDLDAEPDVEPNGDELDGSLSEEDFHDQSANWIGYPGCPVSDPGEDGHDGERDERHG